MKILCLFLRVFSKSRSIFVKNHGFLVETVISRVWENRGNTRTHPPTHAFIVWEVGGGGRGGCFKGLDEGREVVDDRINNRL